MSDSEKGINTQCPQGIFVHTFGKTRPLLLGKVNHNPEGNLVSKIEPPSSEPGPKSWVRSFPKIPAGAQVREETAGIQKLTRPPDDPGKYQAEDDPCP